MSHPRGKIIHFEKSDWHRTIQLGTCNKKPFTKDEADQALREASIGMCTFRCDKCFSEDGEAFWHLAPITYGRVYVALETPEVERLQLKEARQARAGEESE